MLNEKNCPGRDLNPGFYSLSSKDAFDRWTTETQRRAAFNCNFYNQTPEFLRQFKIEEMLTNMLTIIISNNNNRLFAN